jgi:hypothetical protein
VTPILNDTGCIVAAKTLEQDWVEQDWVEPSNANAGRLRNNSTCTSCCIDGMCRHHSNRGATPPPTRSR